MTSGDPSQPDVAQLQRQISQLTEALVGARSIGAAVGIVMAQTKRTYDQGFEYLSRLSQARNVKLRVLAERVVLTGEIPRAD